MVCGGWYGRLGVGREVGTAMTSDEVSDLTTRISIPTLLGYWAAVGERTSEIVRIHGAAGWEKEVDPRLIRRVVRDERARGDLAEQRAFAQMALTHTWGHFFEANTVRSLIREA